MGGGEAWFLPGKIFIQNLRFSVNQNQYMYVHIFAISGSAHVCNS